MKISSVLLKISNLKLFDDPLANPLKGFRQVKRTANLVDGDGLSPPFIINGRQDGR
jgi:hypothetical protein